MAADHYRWNSRALLLAMSAATMEAAKAIVLDPKGEGDGEKNKEMTYLQGVIQSKLDGAIPPFYPNDLVRLKRPAGRLGEKHARVLRTWYLESGTWSIVLEDGWSYRADKLEKVVVHARERRVPAHSHP